MVMRKGRADFVDDDERWRQERGIGPAPEGLVEMWVHAVRTMSREVLDSFTRRTWKDWEPGSLERLKAAILERRRVLDANRDLEWHDPW